MAKETKPKLPRKYRQAKRAARPAAKAEFSGKAKAVRRDPLAKYSAEDREIFKEISKESKGGYITDDKGNKIRVKPTETAKERIARERAEVRRMFEQQDTMDEAKQKARSERMAANRQAILKKNEAAKAARAGKPVPTLQQTPANEKPLSKPVKKAAVKKVAAVKENIGTTRKEGLTPKVEKEIRAKYAAATAKESTKAVNKPVAKPGTYAAGKELNAEGKAIYDRLIKEGVKPKSALNKALFRQEKGAKVAAKAAAPVAKAAKSAADKVKTQGPVKPAQTATSNRPTLKDLQKNEAKGLEEAKARVAAKNQALANSAKGKTQTPQAKKAKAKAAAKPEGKAAKPKFRKIKGLGKAGLVGAVAGELVSLAKGSTKKDFNELGRLEGKLSDITGKGKGGFTAARQGAQMQASNLAALATMGIVGKTRRQRMDELNDLISKAQAKASKPSEPRYGSKGESLVPGTKAYEQGSKTRPTSSITAGGSTNAPSGSSKYTVKKGDTLYGIAKANNTTLAALREANPELMKKKKYKQGSMIWSGTQVRIPKK